MENDWTNDEKNLKKMKWTSELEAIVREKWAKYPFLQRFGKTHLDKMNLTLCDSGANDPEIWTPERCADWSERHFVGEAMKLIEKLHEASGFYCQTFL